MCGFGRLFPFNDDYLKHCQSLFPGGVSITIRERWNRAHVDIVHISGKTGNTPRFNLILCPCDLFASSPVTCCRAREQVFLDRRQEVRIAYESARHMFTEREMIVDILERVHQGEFLGQDKDYGSDLVTMSFLVAVLPYPKNDLLRTLVQMDEEELIQIVPHLEQDPVITFAQQYHRS